MKLPLYSNVKLLTDRYVDWGVSKGDTGVVIEIYEDKGYEVEFMDAQGNTLDCFGVEPSEIEPVQEMQSA